MQIYYSSPTPSLHGREVKSHFAFLCTYPSPLIERGSGGEYKAFSIFVLNPLKTGNYLKAKITKFFFRNPSKYVFWISLAFLLKGLIPFLQLLLGHRADPHLLSFGFIGDTPSYTDPVENLLANGHYSPDHRMPGYGAIYYVLRLLFSYNTTYNTIVIAQLIISSISVYCLALLCRLIAKSDVIFYAAFYFFLISTYSNYYDICLMTEPLCSAFLIFGTWYFALYFENFKLKNLFYSGFFLAWAVFLRPVFVAVLFAYGLILLYYALKNKKKFVKPILLFSISFIIADGAWIVRNYKVDRAFVPLSNGIYYPYIGDSYMRHMQEFVQSWGGAVDLPDPNSDLSWFGGILFPGEPEITHYDSLPDDIYTSKFNKDSLYLLRDKVHAFIAMQKPTVDSFYKAVNKDWFKAFAILYYPVKPVSPAAAALQNNIDAMFDRYKVSIQKEKPYLYYVKSRAILFRKFLFENNGQFFKRGQIPGLGKFMVSFYHFFYLFILFFGIAGMFLLAWKGLRSNILLLLLCIIPAYDMIVHPIIVHLADNRYLLPVWPFVIACAAYTMMVIYEKVKPKKIPINSIYFSAKK